MSSIYIQEPPTHGKVSIETSVGEIEIELWAKETFEELRADVLSDDERRLGIAKRLAELGL